MDLLQWIGLATATTFALVYVGGAVLWYVMSFMPHGPRGGLQVAAIAAVWPIVVVYQNVRARRLRRERT